MSAPPQLRMPGAAGAAPAADGGPPLRICHVSMAEKHGVYQWGGAQTSVRDLAAATAARGHHVHVVAPAEFLRDAHLPPGVTTTAMRVSGGDFGRLVNVLRGGRFDVAVSHLLRSVVLGVHAAWLAGVPVRVSNLHNSLHQEFTNADPDDLKHLAFRAAFRSTLVGGLSSTVAISPSVARETIEHERVPARRVVPIDNWVEPKYRPRPAAERAAVRAELGIGADERLVLFVGRLEHQKRPEVVVRLAAQLPPGHRVVFVGDGVDRAGLEALAAELGVAPVFAGHQRDPAPFMAAADVLAMPSRFEGFGRVAVETFATGTPIVAADVLGLRDALGSLALAPADVTFLADVDPARWSVAVAAAAAQAAAPSEQADATRARRHALVAGRYSMDRAVDAYVALYRRLLGDRRGRGGA